MNNRTCKSVVLIGGPHVGKTTLILKMIEKISKYKKVLIYDINNEEKYKQFEKIRINELSSFSNGIRRVFNPDYNKFIEAVAKHVVNCLIVLEDASIYVSGKRLNDFEKKVIVGRRHLNIDLIFTYHSFSLAQPSILSVTNDLILFKTGEDVKSQKSKIPKYEEVLAKKLMIENSKSQYANGVVKILE